MGVGCFNPTNPIETERIANVEGTENMELTSDDRLFVSGNGCVTYWRVSYR